MHVLIPLYPERKGGATEIKSPQVGIYTISKHSDAVSMRGARLIQEKVKICSFKECYSLLNFQFMAEKKKTCDMPFSRYM